MREHDTCISKLISLCTDMLVMISHLIATVTMFSGNPSDSFSVIYKWILLGNLNFCAGKLESQQSRVGWVVSFIVLAGMAVLAVGGYVIYKYRLRVCIQSALLFVVYDDSGSICKILATLFYDTRNCIGRQGPYHIFCNFGCPFQGVCWRVQPYCEVSLWGDEPL